MFQCSSIRGNGGHGCARGSVPRPCLATSAGSDLALPPPNQIKSPTTPAPPRPVRHASPPRAPPPLLSSPRHHPPNPSPNHSSLPPTAACAPPLSIPTRHARTPSDDTFPYHPLDAPDEETDRVDAVHGAPASCWDDDEEAEIQKLKARLHALEADRESMRRTIVSMGDDKLLLREVAHQLCKQGAVPMTPQPAVLPQRGLVKRRPAGFVKLFIATVIKWIASIFCWRKKSNRIKYPIGLCGSNIGLMLVLDRYPKQRRRKFLKKEPSAEIH